MILNTVFSALQCTEKSHVHAGAKTHGAAAKKKAVHVRKHVARKSGSVKTRKKHVEYAFAHDGEKKYHLVNMNKSWREAEEYCGKTGHGNLVIIKDAKSQQALDSYLKGVGGQ